jgi:hypothetical protein
MILDFYEDVSCVEAAPSSFCGSIRHRAFNLRVGSHLQPWPPVAIDVTPTPDFHQRH